MAGAYEQKLAELGLELPPPAPPAAHYVPWIRTGDLVYVAGQIPVRDGAFHYKGKLGEDLDLAAGQEAARLVALNLLAQVKAACDGDLDRLVQVVKLNGFVNCAPDFEAQSMVINGASDLLGEVLGPAGRHARSAVGVASLPFGVAVEIDGVFRVE